MKIVQISLGIILLTYLTHSSVETAPVFMAPPENHAPVIFNIRYGKKIGIRKKGEIIVVRAMDPDYPPLIYQVVKWTPSEGEQLFKLDSTTGVISVKKGVQLPRQTTFKIDVAVSDGIDTSDPVTITIITRGDMTMALIDAAHDKDESVQEIIANSLLELGKKRPHLVLSSCNVYLKKHNKLSLDHRVVILNAIERIVKETLDSLDAAIANDLIHQASQELTQTKDVEPAWQTAASGVMVAIGTKFCDEVMGELLEKFQPGTLPHFFVLQTMGNLASANVYRMVPHLTAVLGTMLPMLGMAKHDNMRWVFSAALSKFSEAILEYVANIEKAPDPTISKDRFSGEIFSAYDILFNVWLQSKEAKLRLAIIEALGHMCHIMDQDKLEEQLPRMLQGIMGLYKKHPEPFHITQGLSMILDAVCYEGSTVLDVYFDNLMAVLFGQMFIAIDYTNPLSIKNHNEVLRCFTILARAYSGKLVGILLSRLENNNEKTKIGILSIFKHLINSSESSMEDKKEVIVSGLKGICNEQNNKIRKVFAQVVIAMAHHGYLELEGGQLMIEFIVRQCSLPDDPPGKKSADPEYVSNKALRLMCNNILQLITTTIDDMEMVLAGRPSHGSERGLHVLSLMKGISPNLHESLVELWDTVIPKLLQYLEDNLDDEEKWSQKNWEDLLLKMLSKSLDVVDNEEWIVEVGEAFGQQIGHYTNMSGEKNFLYKCLGIIMRKSTKKEFVTKHLDLVFNSVKHTDQTEREGCAIAIGFCAASHLDAALSKLESVAKNDLSKKSGGFLSFVSKDNKSDVDVERIKATLMLCYGFVALYSPPTLIVSRMEATILRTISPYFQNVKSVELRRNLIRTIELLGRCLHPDSLCMIYTFKHRGQLLIHLQDTSVKQNLIRTVSNIGQALHPDHLEQQYNFTTRGEFLTHLQNYMKAESSHNIHNETRALAMNACSTLIKLHPKLSEAEIFDLVKTCTDCVFCLPPDGVSVKKGKEDVYDEMLEAEVLLSTTFDALHEVLKEIINKDPTPMGLESIFKHLINWILSVNDYERERALKTWLFVLEYYIERMDISIVSRFLNEGTFLARLVPRCTDPSNNIRQLAVNCLQATLKIGLRYEGLSADTPDQMIDALPTLKDRLRKSDPSILFSVINDLSKVIAKKLPAEHLEKFIDVLQDGLLDNQSHSASGACVVLNGFMKLRGGEIGSTVEKTLENLYDKLCIIDNQQTRTGTLRTIRTLASHHLLTVLKALLNYKLPYDSVVIEIWGILSQEQSLVAHMLDYFLEVLQKSLPYEEKSKDKDTKKTATNIPLAITCAITVLFKTEETEAEVIKNFYRLFAALIVRLGSSVGVNPPKSVTESEEKVKSKDKRKSAPVVQKKILPIKCAIEAFREFLLRSKADDLIEILDNEGVWEKMEDEKEYSEAMTILARALISCPEEAKHTAKIVANLTSVLQSIYDPQRVVVAAFFAELINQKCAGDELLVELIMNSLLGRLVDSSHIVRMYCIRGLGNIASVGKDQVQKYSTTILSAMMAGMDDKEDMEDDITIEAMSGLSRILSEIDESHIRAILINVALRIRPCFEKDKPAVRAQAFILFGNLSRFGDGPSRQPFLEQIHSNFVSLLLHLNDPDHEVRKACKYALRLLGPLMGSDAINNKFQKHLLEGANLFYGEFMNDLAKLIIQDFPEKINFYVMGCISFFKSMWPEIKSNAAMFSGFLLGNLSKDKQGNISKEHTCSALILLLKDPSPSVRGKASEAMSLLYEY
ncbi:hypothetical protein LOTGIDRAFT_234834 [Lottia gigantea]|uniref:Cadherin domain-containing protein n=1 Tax=Lottia gigantea TaxID=225164 RepID=V4BFQ3_LOTGI|nr:hypothetical protein LOTGIDRAFT_234834 [Lottia gigantea]ESO87809.1 hypothetical protein LOTGIDRAFT_234834 [Lottia gigantea]